MCFFSVGSREALTYLAVNVSHRSSKRNLVGGPCSPQTLRGRAQRTSAKGGGWVVRVNADRGVGGSRACGRPHVHRKSAMYVAAKTHL